MNCSTEGCEEEDRGPAGPSGGSGQMMQGDASAHCYTLLHQHRGWARHLAIGNSVASPNFTVNFAFACPCNYSIYYIGVIRRDGRVYGMSLSQNLKENAQGI